MSLPPMLESTFIHAPTVGRTTELRLWQEGVTDWNRYLALSQSELPLTETQYTALTPVIEESLRRLDEEDFGWFAKRLDAGEHWRAVPSFGHRIAFVDIETTGEMAAEDLTLIGVFDGRTMRHFVKGENLEEFPESIADAAVLVTFFGTGFDLPFIRRRFPRLQMPQLHVDLCYLLRRLGYRGGLKKIEAQLGIGRTNETTGLGGMDAVRLWFEYQGGNLHSRDVLMQYNAEDVRNLSELLTIGFKKMERHIRTGEDVRA